MSWSGKVNGLHPFLVDDEAHVCKDYAVHGALLALRSSQAKNVILLGGGEKARLEYELMRDPNIRYVFYDVRQVDDGGVNNCFSYDSFKEIQEGTTSEPKMLLRSFQKKEDVEDCQIRQDDPRWVGNLINSTNGRLTALGRTDPVFCFCG